MNELHLHPICVEISFVLNWDLEYIFRFLRKSHKVSGYMARFVVVACIHFHNECSQFRLKHCGLNISTNRIGQTNFCLKCENPKIKVDTLWVWRLSNPYGDEGPR
jgi:hypothetical protein